MLSSERIKAIKQFRPSPDFTVEFINDFYSDWSELVARLKKSNIDLKRIPIVGKSKEE